MLYYFLITKLNFLVCNVEIIISENKIHVHLIHSFFLYFRKFSRVIFKRRISLHLHNYIHHHPSRPWRPSRPSRLSPPSRPSPTITPITIRHYPSFLLSPLSNPITPIIPRTTHHAPLPPVILHHHLSSPRWLIGSSTRY